MRIECLKTFLHGRDRFEQGDVRSVPDPDAELFIKNGWARLAGSTGGIPAPSGEPVTLNIASVKHVQEARNG